MALTMQSAKIPHLALALEDLNQRAKYAKAIKDHISIIGSGIHLHHEHHVLIAMTTEESLEREGVLWPGCDEETFVCPETLKEQLDIVSPFCKHYMLHMNPDSLGDYHWIKVLRANRGMKPQPHLSKEFIYQSNAGQILRSIFYQSRFKTLPNLTPILPDYQEENKCHQRSGHRCALTGSNNPRAFRFIPFTWNDSVENNNVTGDLSLGSLLLTDIDLRDNPTKICSARHLGTTNRAWNMISVGQDLYEYLTLGLCAFEFVERNGVIVTLRFYWMPRMSPRFGKGMDMNSLEEVSNELKTIHSEGYPAPERYHNEWRSWSKFEAKSGQSIHLKMPGVDDAEMLEYVVRVHWGCVLFTALCGGAGFPPYMTGMNLEDGSLQCVGKDSLEDVSLETVKQLAEERRSAAGPKER